MTVSSHIGEDELREILDGLEGVTPGPYNPARDFDFQTDPIASFETTDSDANGGHRIANFFGPERFANAQHSQRLDPDTVRSIVTELLDRRSAGLGTVSVKLREALETIRELNMTNADGNGHRWANSDLIDQEIVAALSCLTSGVRCTYCDGSGDVHRADGEWLGTCHCAQQPGPAVTASARTIALEIWERLDAFFPPVYSPRGGTCPPCVIDAANAIMEMITEKSCLTSIGVEAGKS